VFDLSFDSVCEECKPLWRGDIDQVDGQLFSAVCALDFDWWSSPSTGVQQQPTMTSPSLAIRNNTSPAPRTSRKRRRSNADVRPFLEQKRLKETLPRRKRLQAVSNPLPRSTPPITVEEPVFDIENLFIDLKVPDMPLQILPEPDYSQWLNQDSFVDAPSTTNPSKIGKFTLHLSVSEMLTSFFSPVCRATYA
jgi:hypothetical protein